VSEGAAAGAEAAAASEQREPPASALALCESVAASLPDLQAPSKRQRLLGSSGSARWQHVDKLPAVIEAVRAAAPHLQVELMNSFTNTRAHHPRQADEVRVLCPGVFCAAVAIAGGGRTEPVRVAVDAADVAIDVHGWAASSHQARVALGEGGVCGACECAP